MRIRITISTEFDVNEALYKPGDNPLVLEHAAAEDVLIGVIENGGDYKVSSTLIGFYDSVGNERGYTLTRTESKK